VAQIAAYLAGLKLWLGIGSVAGRSVCCNFDDFGRIFAAEMFGRPISIRTTGEANWPSEREPIRIGPICQAP